MLNDILYKCFVQVFKLEVLSNLRLAVNALSAKLSNDLYLHLPNQATQVIITLLLTAFINDSSSFRPAAYITLVSQVSIDHFA